MPVDLHVTFAGMCIIVHRSGEMYALLPHTPTHAHSAVVVYDRRHDPSATHTKPLEMLDLEGGLIDLTSLPSSGSPDVHTDIFDFTDILGRRVPKRLLTIEVPSAADAIRARVVMATGRKGRRFPGGRWRLDDKGPHSMPTWAEWEIPDAGQDSVTLAIRGPNPTQRTLFPIGGRKIIEVFVLNVPTEELPDDLPVLGPPTRIPGPNHGVDHFADYYPMLAPPDMGPIPKFVDAGGLTQVPLDRDPDAIVGREFTCIMARADPQGT